VTCLRRPEPSLRQRLAWGVLLLALVLGPALGRVHQIVHGAGSGSQATTSHAAAQGTARQALDVLHALFAGHGHADCQALDQQSTLGGAWQAPALALSQAAPQAVPAGVAPTPRAGRRPSPFHARAPPERA